MLKDKVFFRSLFIIAVPIIMQNLISSLLNMIDVFMISDLSTASIGGVGMANKVFFLLNLFLFGTISGASILSSQYFGKNDFRNIRRVLGATLIIGLSGTALFAMGAILIPETIMKILAPGEDDMIREGAKYLRITGFSYGFMAISFTYGFLLRTTRNTLIPMMVSILAIIMNTFLNWVLIYGNLGAPELSVEGAAYATLIARVFEAVAILVLVHGMKLPLAGKLREVFDLPKAFWSHYMKTVIFVIFNELSWALGIVGYSLAYGRMGEVATASITIVQTIEQLAFVALFGLCNACAVMLGNAMGANDLHQAEQYAKRYVKIMVSLAVVIGILMFLGANTISRFFDVEPIVRKNVVYCLYAFCLYLPLKAINMIMIVGIFRSGGDTVASLLIDLSGVYLVGLPLAFIGALVFRLEIPYVYAMVMMEEPLKVILCIIRYTKKKWLKNMVTEII